MVALQTHQIRKVSAEDSDKRHDGQANFKCRGSSTNTDAAKNTLLWTHRQMTVRVRVKVRHRTSKPHYQTNNTSNAGVKINHDPFVASLNT